ncbi:MAG: hypothetical protein ACI8PZ_000366 [Myxococcota bacterium]|jgi:hypothetical protein
MSRLRELQGWLQDRIAKPREGDADGIVAAGDGFTPEARLQVYAGAYRDRLLGCLRAEFPALRTVLGAELFDGFGRVYVGAVPPSSYTLHELGAGVPAFLEENRPDRDAEVRELWPDFMVDLAVLERAFSEAYHGPGPEGWATLPAPWERGPATLVPNPALRLLDSRFPLLDTLQQGRRGELAPMPAAGPATLAIVRHRYRVQCVPVGPARREWVAAVADQERTVIPATSPRVDDARWCLAHHVLLAVRG